MVSLLSALIPATPAAGPAPTGRGSVDPAAAADFGALLSIAPGDAPATPVDPDAVGRQPLAVSGTALPAATFPADEAPSRAPAAGKTAVSTRAILMAQLSPASPVASTPRAILVAGPTAPPPTGMLAAAALDPLIYVDGTPAAPFGSPMAAPLAPLIYVDDAPTAAAPAFPTAAPLAPLIYVDDAPTAAPAGGTVPIEEPPAGSLPIAARRTAVPAPLRGIDTGPIILVDGPAPARPPIGSRDAAHGSPGPIVTPLPSAKSGKAPRDADEDAVAEPPASARFPGDASPWAATLPPPTPPVADLPSRPAMAPQPEPTAMRAALPPSVEPRVASADASSPRPIPAPAPATTTPASQSASRDRGAPLPDGAARVDPGASPARSATVSFLEATPDAPAEVPSRPQELPAPSRPAAEPAESAPLPRVAGARAGSGSGGNAETATATPAVPLPTADVDPAPAGSNDDVTPFPAPRAIPRAGARVLQSPLRQPTPVDTVAIASPAMPPLARPSAETPVTAPATPGAATPSQHPDVIAASPGAAAPAVPESRAPAPPAPAEPTPTMPPASAAPTVRAIPAPNGVDLTSSAPTAPLVNRGDRTPQTAAEEPAPKPPASRTEPAFRAFAAAMFDAATAVAPSAPVERAADRTPLDLTQPRWPHVMVDRIERLRDEASLGDTRIRLIPDALGTIDVALRRDGDTVHVAFRADQAETRQLLADARPELTALAEARGIKLAEAAPTPAPTGSWAGTGSNPGQGFAGDRGPRPQPQPSTPAAPPRAAAAADEAGDDTRIA